MAQTIQQDTERIRLRLIQAVTDYDRKESTKRGWSMYALGHYFRAIRQVADEMEAGTAPRKALVANLTGRLLDTCLKVIGESPATREELR
jgi:hypothetical protein